MKDFDRVSEHRPVPKSPTGRVPKWALDEAMGRPSEPVPWRAGPTTTAGATPPRERRARSLSWLVVVLLVAGGVVLSQQLKASGPGQQANSVAADSQFAPPAGVEEAKQPLGSPPAVAEEAEGPRFRFLQHQRDSSRPVAWSPCRPIHYVVRPDNAPAGADQLLNQAIGAISQASGLTFVNDGATSEGPVEDRAFFQPARYGKRWAPVLITWATATEVPDFGVDVAGEAGPVGLVTTSLDAAYVTGELHMDAAWVASALGRPGGAGHVRGVLLHELGHLVGLAHVPDKWQVMFPKGAVAEQLGSGDKAGLAVLGRGACQPDI